MNFGGPLGHIGLVNLTHMVYYLLKFYFNVVTSYQMCFKLSMITVTAFLLFYTSFDVLDLHVGSKVHEKARILLLLLLITMSFRMLLVL